MKLIGFGLTALAASTYADSCGSLSKKDCKGSETCKIDREASGYSCIARTDKPEKPTFDGDCATADKTECKKHEACQYDRVSDTCCKAGDPCPPLPDSCPGLDKKTCNKVDKCKWDSKKGSCIEPIECAYGCSTKTDKCCKTAMKDKETGRKDADKCYLDRSSGTTKDRRCVDHTDCAQVKKKGWCTKFFKRSPWHCEWNKGTGVCEKVEPYVEPETCEGKSKEDCDKHADKCVSWSKEKGCTSFKEGESDCADLWTKKDCKKFKCDWEKATKKCKKGYEEPDTCEGKHKADCDKHGDKCLGWHKEKGCVTFVEGTTKCEDLWTKKDCIKHKCGYEKATKKCKKGYEEPDTCAGKSKDDCAKHPKKCLPWDSESKSCKPFEGCDGLDAKLCKKMGCYVHGDGSCHAECPEGFSGDDCEIDDSKICKTLSSSDADYDFTVVALRRIGDLGIVMDVSGSMATEIAGVKAGIISAASGIIGGTNPPYARGAVMEYSDPSTRFLGIGGEAVFKANVAKITRGMGKSEWGGDCPEVMFKGISACMDVISGWSTIYAITDASAKDPGLAAAVRKIAKARHIRINFILTATCAKWYESPPFTGIHSVYKKTADGTGGQIYQITKSSSLGPKVTAVIAAAAHDALATTDVAYFEFSGSTNNVTVDGHNHMTNFHITVAGANAGLSCTAQDGAAVGSDAHVIVNITTVKTWSVARVADSGRHLWHDKLVCATSASASYTVTVRSGYSKCAKNWCKGGGTCKHNEKCGIFTCECPSGKGGIYCEKDAATTPAPTTPAATTPAATTPAATTPAATTPAATTPAPTTPAVTTPAPKWEGFKITHFAPDHVLSAIKDGISGWTTGNFIYHGFPSYLQGMAYLKSEKIIVKGTDIDIHYIPATAVGAVYFIIPDGTSVSKMNMGWKTDDDAKEGEHLSVVYGFTKLDYKGIYYINMDAKTKTKQHRAIWKKAFDGSGKILFKPITDDKLSGDGTGGLSCSIAFEINKLCDTCADI